MKSGCSNKKELKKQKSIELPVLNTSAKEHGDISKSRTSRWRAAALITLNLLMIAHIIQWWIMGKTVTPIEPSESMYTLQNGAINAGFIFFTLAILATLIFGRFVCGWGCHILALQDLCGWILKKIGLKPKAFRSRLLIFVPLLVALYMFVYPTVYRFFVKPANEPLIPEWTNHLMTTDFWATFPPVWIAVPFLFVCGFMTVYFLGQKGFCTYACPYGGFFAVADKIAPGKIRVTDACEQCGHCTAVCTSNVLVHKEVKEYGMVVDQGCMKCMDCVSVCPNDALYYGFGKPAVGVEKTVKKNYSLSWPEEIAAAVIFFASFMAVWDVYQLVPMLMALGIATVTTFVAMKSWRIFSAKNTSFYRFNLKSSGRIKTAGWIFAGLSIVWIGLNIHSGFIHYHESAGKRAFENIRLPDELALAQANPAEWLNSNDRQNILEGKKHLSTARNFSLLTNFDALPKLAWFEFLSGNPEQAVKLLDTATEHQKGQAKALSFYYQGAILNRLGRFEDAAKNFDAALEISPNLILALEQKGESLWQLGKKEEAVAVWKEAVKQSPALPLTNNFLAAATESLGNTAESINYEKQAERYTPRDALFQWMLGLRLENAGMKKLAGKHFNSAVQLNPAFRLRKK